MKKSGILVVLFFHVLVGCSNNKNGNLLNASSFPLILTTIIEKKKT